MERGSIPLTAPKPPPLHEPGSAGNNSNQDRIESRYRRFFMFVSALSTAGIVIIAICYAFYYMFK